MNRRGRPRRGCSERPPAGQVAPHASTAEGSRKAQHPYRCLRNRRPTAKIAVLALSPHSPRISMLDASVSKRVRQKRVFFFASRCFFRKPFALKACTRQPTLRFGGYGGGLANVIRAGVYFANTGTGVFVCWVSFNGCPWASPKVAWPCQG